MTEEAVVLQRAHFVDDAPGAVGTLAKRLHAAGWTVTMQESAARIPATLYVANSDGHSKGDVLYPAYVETLYSISAFKKSDDGKHFLALDATWAQREGKGLAFQSARTYDPYLGHEHRVGYLRGRKPNEWELADGIEPPMGLKQWLDLMVPAAKKGAKK